MEENHKNKIIVYPGTFNPITNAHISIAQKAVGYVGASTLIFLPTGINDILSKKDYIQESKKLQMIEKCLPLLNTGKEEYIIDTYEIDEGDKQFRLKMYGKKNYQEVQGTYHSVAKIEKRYPNSEIYILMGDDNAVEVNEWVEHEKLMSSFKFLVIPRDYELKKLNKELKNIWKKNYKNITILPCDVRGISSSRVRDCIKYGEYNKAKEMVPEIVFNHFIVNDYYNLYSEKQCALQKVYRTLDNYLKAFDENAELIIDKIIEKMKNKLETTGCKGYVLGMSGGLDCSVMAALCHRGNIPMKLISMPSNESMDGKPMEHAKAVAEIFNKGKLEIDNIYLEINNINIFANESCNTQYVKDDMAYANIAPRVRMTVLYTIAQRMNYLVLGTSNLSEITMGYFTKWGDGAADIEPIAPYVKSEVRVLAKRLFNPYNNKMLEEIINKPPSAELWSGQTDEEEMGFTYNQIDTYLRLWSGDLVGKIPSIEVDEEIIDKIRDIEANNRHKRISLIK